MDFAGYDGRVLAGVAMVLGTSLSIQLAAALASTEFDRLGPGGVSSLRFFAGTVILIAAARPSVRGRSHATWAAITAYGASLALLNLCFFEAINLIPLGVAVSLSFVAPLAMACTSTPNRQTIGYALLAAAGIVTLGGIDRPSSLTGVTLALLAGCAWVAVAYTGRSVGSRTHHADGLALALPVSTLVAAPFGIGAASKLDPHAIAVVLLVAIGGLILPFTLELEALRRLQPATIAIIYSIDPAIAATVGLLALNQHLTTTQLLGILAVTTASIAVTRTAAQHTTS